MNRSLLILVFSFVGLVSGQETKLDAPPAKSPTLFSESTPYIPRQLPVVEKKKKEKAPKASDPKVEPPQVVRNEVKQDSVIIPVNVFDGNGQIVSGLKASEIEAFIDNKPAEIISIESKNEPLNIVLVFDLSPSADVVIDKMKKAADRLVAGLQPDDRVMIVGFNIETKVLLDFTTDREVIVKSSKKMKMGDGTSLYNTIAELLENNLAALNGPTAVLLMTDGVDTTSRKASYESSLKLAETHRVTFFPMYFDTYAEIEALNARNLQKIDSDIIAALMKKLYPSGLGKLDKAEYERGRYYLNDLIQLSGGHLAPIADSMSGKAWALDIIPSEMRSRYYLKLRVAEGGKAGDSRQVKVRVKRPALTILAKGSYIQN